MLSLVTPVPWVSVHLHNSTSYKFPAYSLLYVSIKSAQTYWFKTDEEQTFSLDTRSFRRGNYYMENSHYNYQNRTLVKWAQLYSWDMDLMPKSSKLADIHTVQSTTCWVLNLWEMWPTCTSWRHPRFLNSIVIQAAQLAYLVLPNIEPVHGWNFRFQETENQPNAIRNRDLNLQESAQLPSSSVYW